MSPIFVCKGENQGEVKVQEREIFLYIRIRPCLPPSSPLPIESQFPFVPILAPPSQCSGCLSSIRTGVWAPSPLPAPAPLWNSGGNPGASLPLNRQQLTPAPMRASTWIKCHHCPALLWCHAAWGAILVLQGQRCQGVGYHAKPSGEPLASHARGASQLLDLGGPIERWQPRGSQLKGRRQWMYMGRGGDKVVGCTVVRVSTRGNLLHQLCVLALVYNKWCSPDYPMRQMQVWQHKGLRTHRVLKKKSSVLPRSQHEQSWRISPWKPTWLQNCRSGS